MDEGDRAIEIKEEPTEETDQEKLLRETTSLLRQSESCTFSIQVAPGTTMHINISPESVLEIDSNPDQRVTASWCISTLMIHNGQHYANTIHNFSVGPEQFRNLILARQPAVQMLQQLLMDSMELPSDSLQVGSPHILAQGHFLNPTALLRMVEHYCDYVMRTARILDNVIGLVGPERSAEVPALMQNLRNSSESLQSVLEQVEESVQEAEERSAPIAPIEPMVVQEEDPPEPEQLKIGEDSSTEDTDDDLARDLHIAEVQAQSCTTDYSRYVDFVAMQLKCDSDSTSTDSDMDSSTYLGPRYEETPQQFWSLSSSSEEEIDDDQPDEDSWESDYGDEDSFDAYMVRQLRAHSNGFSSRLNTGWSPNDRTLGDDDEWDIGSCGTNYEIEDVGSEISCDSEDLNAWQYREDRSFETELSRPFRRLVGDLPPQTAQEERYAWRHSYEHFDFRRSLFAALEMEGPNHTVPFSYYSQWDQQDTLAFTSSASSLSDGGFSQIPEPYPFSFYANAMDNINNSLQPDLSQLQGIELDDAALARGAALASNSESEVDQLTMDIDTEGRLIPPDQQIVPLESYVQQTDELIAKMLASL